MAVFPPFFEGLVEARVTQTGPTSSEMVNVLYFGRAGAAAFSVEALEIDSSLRQMYTTLATQSLSSQWRVTHIDYIDRSEADGESLTTNTDIIGANAGDALNSAFACCISWRTAQTGRRHRGRTFITGWAEASNSGTAHILDATVTVVQNAANALLATLALDSHALVILSRVGQELTQVTTATVDNRWDIQRRRNDF